MASANDLYDVYDGVLRTCSDFSADLVIPGDLGITSIDRDVFRNWTMDSKKKITSVTIPEGVTSIAGFHGMRSLVTVKLPSTLKVIEDYCFNTDESLTTINLPEGLERIGVQAFSDCLALQDFTFPSTLKVIDHSAFSMCESLTTVALPASLEKLGNQAFQRCVSLTSFTMHDGFPWLNHAVSECPKLESLTLSPTLTDVDIGGCPAMKTLTIPADMKAEQLHIHDMNGLASLTLPGGSQFQINDCENLTDVTVMNGMESLGLIKECPKLATVTIPPSITWIGDDNFEGCPSDFTIIGKKGSYAEQFAKQTGHPFKPLQISLNKATVTVADATYTGKAIKPTVTVMLDGDKLVQGTDYTVSCASKAVGKGTVTIKGKGLYIDSVKKAFKINPKPVKGLALKAGKKSLTATWKKVSGVTGYQLQYGLKKNFKGAKTTTIKGAAKLKKAVTKLKGGKTYYVRVRAYKKVSGKTYYSDWSGRISVKTK